jgi:hypothetical protein
MFYYLNKKQEEAILVRRCFSLFIIDFVCEIAYVILPVRTTYSRFTSTTPKRSRPFTLPKDSKYVVELAVISARFKPSGLTLPPYRSLIRRMNLFKITSTWYFFVGVSQK